MRYLWILPLLLALSLFVPLASAQEEPAPEQAAEQPPEASYFSPEQLDNLVAPVALYPDPLLAQLLPASTFPEQVDEAARFVRAHADPNYIDSQPWDVSVKSVAHYPSVVYMLAEKNDWTTSIGQAYVAQPDDVMAAVQRLRRQARDAGHLRTSREHEVVETEGYIHIYPANPRYIYVPTYDPAYVYVRHPGYYGRPVISFGAGFMIGAWLNHELDWHHHRVIYSDWEHGHGWMLRSRPYVRVNHIYVHNNHRTVIVNHRVIDRPVRYGGLNHYNSVHRRVDFNHVTRGHREGGRIIEHRPGDRRPGTFGRHEPMRGRGPETFGRREPMRGRGPETFGRREPMRGRGPETFGRHEPMRGAEPGRRGPETFGRREPVRGGEPARMGGRDRGTIPQRVDTRDRPPFGQGQRRTGPDLHPVGPQGRDSPGRGEGRRGTDFGGMRGQRGGGDAAGEGRRGTDMGGMRGQRGGGDAAGGGRRGTDVGGQHGQGGQGAARGQGGQRSDAQHTQPGRDGQRSHEGRRQ
jgi:hypothetical protein